MKTEVIHLYEERPEVTLTTYLLADSTETLNGGHRPAIIICPGGGYFNCCDREGEPIAMHFASMGYHTFVLRYSNYSGGNGLCQPDLSVPVPPKPEVQHPAPMRDIAAAMLTIRANANEWLVDTNRIALCGFSAGAHNCAMYATNWHKPIISEFFGEDTEVFRPAAAILAYTISDYVYMKENPAKDPFLETFMDAIRVSLIGVPTADNETLKAVSPAHNVSEFTPPTFLWATAEDALIPVQHTLLMAQALADKKIPFELHVFEKGGHGLSEATQASASSLSSMNPDVAKWVSLCNAWLLKRFALDLPPLSVWETMDHNFS